MFSRSANLGTTFYVFLFICILCVLINNYIKYLLHKYRSGASRFSLYYFSEGSHYWIVSVCEAAVCESRVPHILLPGWHTPSLKKFFCSQKITAFFLLSIVCTFLSYWDPVSPAIFVPLPIFQIHLFYNIIYSSAVCLSNLLCSSRQEFLYTGSTLQVDYRPATCNSIEHCPVYEVQISCAVS